MSEYHKIQTIFKRDMAQPRKPLIEGEWTLPEFAYLANNEWEFTEKVDGTNIRVTVAPDGAVEFGGRTDAAQIPAPLIAKLYGYFAPVKAELAAQFPEGAILYGEGYGGKIQGGSKTYGPEQDFVLFDILVSNAAYDTIKSCPRHCELINATLNDLITLEGFVNPAITRTLRNKILSGQTTSKEGRSNTLEQTEGERPRNTQLGGATYEQNLESPLKNLSACDQYRMAYAQSAASQTHGKGEQDRPCRSPSITATTQAGSGDCSVTPAIRRFIKRSESLSGSMPPECTCKIKDWWLGRDAVIGIAKQFGLRVVPTFGNGTLHNAVELARGGFRSEWGDFWAEGIVARPIVELKARSGARIIAKIKHCDFYIGG